MKVLLLSRYGPLGASSRVRYLQYLPYFRERGVDVDVAPLFSDTYLQALYSGRGRLREVLIGYARRVGALLLARRFHVVILEKELFPFLPAGLERLLCAMGVRYVADYDDALFHRYDLHHRMMVRRMLGRKIDAVMRNAAVVVAGNDYLAERARQAGARRIEIIPTVVDAERYQARGGVGNDVPVVGWIGTPQTSRYLMPLLPVFEALKRQTAVRFVAIGAKEGDFAGTSVESWSWSAATEVASIQQCDIGIMPLEDSPWERGKCGYKLIQYMACGLPVVASPVGVNRAIVDPGRNGLLADTTEDWHRALRDLLDRDPEGRQTMGAAGRELVERWYSLQAQAPRLLAAVQGVTR